jgi:hypothetical protein
MKILYNSHDVRTEVRRLFETGRRRRVAVVAFVGETAESHLRRPRGIELYCWDAPGTNPAAVKLLRDELGVKCYFVSNLHAKVYYAEGVGCVVTSANLSSYALAGGKLKEAGVLLDAGTVDIDRLLREMEPRKVTNARLKELQTQIAKAKRKFGGGGALQTFLDWYNLPPSERQSAKWRLSPYSKGANRSNKAVRKHGKDQYARKEPAEYIECDGELEKESFILSAAVGGSGRAPFKSVSWMFVDDVYPFTRMERAKSDFTHQAVQWYAIGRYRDCPFRADRKFLDALNSVLRGMSPRQRGALVAEHKTHALTEGILKAVAEAYSA